MEYKYINKIMRNKLLKSTNLIKLVLFLFLGIWSTNANAQCSPDIDPNYSSCTGDSIQITAAPGFNYSWSTGETTQSIWVLTSDSVWVVITDSICGADSSSFFTPTIVTILDPTISPSDTTICFGDSITLCTGNNTSTGLLNQMITVTRLQETNSGAPLKADFPEDNDWHYVVITKDSQSSLEGKIYIDGQLAATGAWQNQGYSYNSLYLGATRYIGWSAHLDGWLDEVRVSNIVRDSAAIANHWNNGNAIEFTADMNTLGLWHMNETLGTTFLNSVSGNGDLLPGASFPSAPVGKFGNAVRFDGITGRADCNINIPEYSVTIEYWVKLDGMQVATFIQPYGSYSSRSGVVVDTIIINSTYIWSTGDTTGCVNVSPNQTTTYWVTQSQNGVSCSDSVDITVYPEINISATVNNNSSQAACNGDIFATAQGQLPLSYQWDTSGVFYSNQQVIQGLCENTYCLTVTDGNGCIADSCFNVEWNPCNLNATIITPIDCNGGQASVRFTVDTIAGTGPFPYANPRFVYKLYSTNPLNLEQTVPFGLPSFVFNNLLAGEHLVSVFDKSWNDSCFTTIQITEPDPILIYTTVDSTSSTWVNDGSILIDSITGGGGTYTITWYDSSYTQSPPGISNPLLTDSLLWDSIYFSHDYYGGYTILITDTNGCTQDTTLYVYPLITSTGFDTVYVSQHETCFGMNDGKIFASMNDSAIPPFTYYWMDVTGDTIRVDCLGCPPPSNYNAVSHVATHTNLPPGFYSLGVSDALGNVGELKDGIIINAADSMYVYIDPDQDSITLDCSLARVLTAVANPLPGIAQLMPDTQLIANNSGNTTFTLDFNTGTVNGATYSLYDSPQRTYYIECTGTLTDASNPQVSYDAAFMDWPGNPTPQNSIWSWNNSTGGSVPLLNSSLYDGVNHTYNWNFPANSNSAVQNLLNPNLYDHQFHVNTTIITGQLTCQVFGVVDTIIYNYVWTTVANPGTVLSTNDTLLTDSSIIITTDYVVTVTNTNGCFASDTIRVKKDLNTLTLNPTVITPVRPCYGDLTGEIHIDVVDSSGIQPFIYILYDVDTNFIQSTSDTFFTGLASGNYVIQVQDTIGCLNPFALVYIDQPDTIFACGVDELNDTIFDIFTHTVIANDPLTWNFQTGILAPNFQYYLEVDGTFGLFTIQQAPPYDQDAAFNDYDGLINSNPFTGVPIPGPWWTVDGDVLRPDIDVYNPTHTYIYNSPSEVNGSSLPIVTTDYFTGTGNALNFEFLGLNSHWVDTIHNQGGLVFRLHKIACTQTDTAFTCKGEGLAFAYVRSQSVNGNLGGIPYAGADGILGTPDDYYETAWININTGDTIQGGPGYGPSDTVVGLASGSYKVVVIDSLGCSEFVRYLEVLEPIDTFITVLDTVINVMCKYDFTGEIHLSNFGGFDSVATNGNNIVPIASTTSRYAVLLRDITSYNSCGDINTIVPQADYSDTIAVLYGVLDSIIFDSLDAHRYRVYVYDSIPDATYGKYNPFTGELLANPFQYMQCPEIIDVFITEPCDSLSSFTSVLADVKCWGDSSARAFVKAAGGALTYSYQWHNAPFGINGVGQVGNTADSLWADTLVNSFPNILWHTVTITDANGCTLEDSVQIKHLNRKIRPFYLDALSDTVWSIKLIKDSVNCFGDCNGEVSLETFGGVYPHSYVWDIGQTSLHMPDTAFNLCAGGHDVLVQDYVGCQEIIRFRIHEPSQLFAIGAEVTPINCFGYNDGTGYAYGIGGNNLTNSQSSYTFNWLIDSTTYNVDSLIGVGQSIDSLPPGLHIIQITDYKGCYASDTVEIIEPTKLSVVIVDSLITYAYCEYTESAKLCAQAFGGTPGYVYQWDDANGQNNTTAALAADIPFCAVSLTPINVNSIDGKYNVLVIDDRGCIADTAIDIDTITNSFNVNSIITTATDVSCFGGFNGSIVINQFNIVDSVVNGVTFFHTISLPNSSYSYTWTGPNNFSQTTQNISALVAGSYAIIVEDSMSCKRTKNIQILEPDQLYFSIYNSTEQTCIGDSNTLNSYGSCDGQIMVNITGGTGTYYYDVTEANVFPIPSLNQVTIINDTLIDSLCDGLHNIYITDDKNCEGQVIPGGIGWKEINTTVVVSIPGVMTAPTNCFNTNDGDAWIQWPGADPLLNYTWETSPAGIVAHTGPSASLYQGNYVLVAHYADAASFGISYPGCDATTAFTMSGPSEMLPNQIIISPLCWGDNNGSITLSPSGGTPGTPAYTYLWDNTVSLPSGATTSSVNNLLAGTYGVTITDGNGCDTSIAITVVQPDQIQNDFTINDVLCNGDATGSIIANTTGGVGSYIYDWGTNNPNAISVGIYSFNITDANGCTITDEAIVNEPNPLIVSLYDTNAISCNGYNDGVVLAVVQGGVGPYAYSWSDGQIINPAISLSAGNLSLDITDANNCPVSDSIVLIEPTIIVDNATLSTNSYGFEVSCFEGSDGWISLIPTGGVPNSNGSYSYIWTNSASVDSVANGLSATNYSVDIIDANGCVYPFSYILTSPDEMFNASVTTANYAGPSHPPVIVSFVDSTTNNVGTPILVNHNWYWYETGAAEPFTNSGFMTFSHAFNKVGLNEVYVLVQNANTGCIDTIEFTIEVQGIDFTSNVFSPNNDGVNDVFVFDEYGIDIVSVEIYNRWGSLVMNWTELSQGWDGKGSDGQDLPEAVYFYVLTAEGEDGSYYEKKGSVTIMR